MDDVELRYALLEKAKSLMLSEWENKVKVEEAVARFEGRAPTIIRQPTLHRIMVLAEKFYGFVKAPPVSPVNPITPTNAKPSETPTGLEVSQEESLGLLEGSEEPQEPEESEDPQEFEDESPDTSSEE